MDYILLAAFVIPILMYLLTLFQEHYPKQCELFPVTNDAFDQEWPPISDEEFLELCGSRTDPKIALKVREIVSKVSGIDENQIYPDQRLRHDLDLDND